MTLLALSNLRPVATFSCGDFSVTYVLDGKNHAVGLRLLPLAKADRVVPHREYIDTPEIPAVWRPFSAYKGDPSLIQIKLAEDETRDGFGGGRSMCHNATVEALRLVEQRIETGATGGFTIRTVLRGGREFLCTHVLTYEPGDDAVTVHTEFENRGDASLSLEMLSSFAFGYLSPFDAEDSPERLRLHRFRSLWSSEGRHEAPLLEDLHLERSWSGYGVTNERFGQVGSMPVRGFFPFVAIEDIPEGVFWGAQLACASSWQMEAYRREDKVSLSGGLADREFGHWMKRVVPGEIFVTPRAFLSTAVGDLDAFSQRLTRMQAKPLSNLPALENDLPIIFNEWCSSWGSPTPQFISETAERLQQTPTRVFVIDAGWAEKREGFSQFSGDWNVNRRSFPAGLKPVADSLRKRGFVPGLWFEFEICTEGTEAFALPDHKLRRDGKLLKVGPRHFLDFTDPWTFEYLTKKVIGRLRDDGFGYLKVDYNETIGMGCDDPDSLGEGLRKHIAGVERFFRKLREELPNLIIEVCSSGGHRLEPAMLALGAMGSFSDAHESLAIPIIAANLHRLILPRQSQIWAVLHAGDTLERIHYSLAACFLGRACLSGEITTLSVEQFSLVQEDLAFYERVKHLIRDGESKIYRQMNRSYQHPCGSQAVVRTSRSSPKEALVVVHVFGGSDVNTVAIAMPGGPWSTKEERGWGIGKGRSENGTLHLDIEKPFSAYVGHFLAE
jgi:alpha-galactosidase